MVATVVVVVAIVEVGTAVITHTRREYSRLQAGGHQGCALEGGDGVGHRIGTSAGRPHPLPVRQEPGQGLWLDRLDLAAQDGQ